MSVNKTISIPEDLWKQWELYCNYPFSHWVQRRMEAAIKDKMVEAGTLTPKVKKNLPLHRVLPDGSLETTSMNE